MLLCVKCPFCSYRAVLDEDDLRALSATPQSTVADLLRKLRCEFCGFQAVQLAWEEDLAAWQKEQLSSRRTEAVPRPAS